MEATFRAPAPNMFVMISIPMYAKAHKSVELEENRKPQCIGVDYMRCLFCEGKEHNQLTLQDARDIIDMRAYIENKEGFIEVSCDKEAAAMLGGGCQSTGGDHEQHKKELQEKYGEGNTDPELGNWETGILKCEAD